MDHPTPIPLADLARQVADLSNAVVARARAVGRDDLADLLTGAAARWADPQVTVVVAGEVGVGKSALVNALAGAHGLLPVASEPTTGVVTIVEAAPPDATGPVAVVSLDDRAEPLAVDPADLPGWLSLHGEHRGAVAQATVAVPNPRVGPRVTLVDTPGVAGPDTSADRLVLALLGRADLLLFVTDPDAPIGRPELDFLRRAKEEIATCIVAVARVDRFRGWPTILEDSRAILDRELGDWVRQTAPVSSSLDEAAAEVADDDPSAAAELADEAGVAALGRLLADLSQRAKHLRLRSLLAATRRVVAELARPTQEAAHDATATVEELRSELDRVREEHAALKASGTAVLTALADEMTALREDLGVELRRAVGEVTLDHEERLLNAKVDPDEVLDAIEHDLRAAQLRLADLTEERLAAVGARLADRLDGEDLPDDESDDDDGDGRPRRTVTSRPDGSLRLRVAAAVASAGGGTVMMGMSFMSTSGGANALRGGLMGVSMLLGSVVASAGVRQTRQQKVLQTVRAQARAILDEWQAATMARTRARLQAGQRELDAALRSAVKGRLAELEGRVKDLNDALQADAAARQARGEQAGRASAELGELDRRAAELEGGVRDALGPVTGLVPAVRS